MGFSVMAFPFPEGDYYFSQPWTLDGVTYLFTFRYNTRAQTWFVDLADANSAPIVGSIALRPARNLLSAYASRQVPKGALFVLDSTGNNTDPGPDSFASTHTLYYGSLT